jgi:hypothetical protein
MEKTGTKSVTRENRSICLPFSQENYESIINKPIDFRLCIDQLIELLPELFPSEITKGYRMKDIYWSKKLNINTRRIEIEKVSYTIRPSFLMPYMTGITDNIEHALFLRKFNVPFWALSHVFGKYPMYWYRIEQAIGRNSIVGTTVRNPDDIPMHLAADEKHTKLLGKKVYVATTVGNECILGASISTSAGEESLKDAYQIVKNEARHINPKYSPKTVNIDGWKGTQNAWTRLFPGIAIICCFLHVFIKIRDRAKKKYKDIFEMVADKLWDCYRAENKSSFSQRIRRLLEWCNEKEAPDVIQLPIQKLRKNSKAYHIAYDHPDAHRTSNMLDRLMQRMDRYLFNTQYFHGFLHAANLGVRGWALIQNFAPSNPMTVKKHNGLKSPAERLNNFRYHENWLHNMMISSSLGGFRRPPLNPL